MATSGRHMARCSARHCAIGPVRTVPIHPSSQTTRFSVAFTVGADRAQELTVHLRQTPGPDFPAQVVGRYVNRPQRWPPGPAHEQERQTRYGKQSRRVRPEAVSRSEGPSAENDSRTQDLGG